MGKTGILFTGDGGQTTRKVLRRSRRRWQGALQSERCCSGCWAGSSGSEQRVLLLAGCCLPARHQFPSSQVARFLPGSPIPPSAAAVSQSFTGCTCRVSGRGVSIATFLKKKKKFNTDESITQAVHGNNVLLN